MDFQWVYDAEELAVFLIGVAILFVVTEASYQWARRRDSPTKDVTRRRVQALEAATLGLLALLIGFTFSVAFSQFDNRKQLVVDEANAIGTTALRARFLPQPQSSDVVGLLRDYATTRLTFFAESNEPAKFQATIRRSLTLHDQLWHEATAASAENPRSIPVGLFVQSLNELIDLHEKRLTAFRTYLPAAVFVALYLVAVIALGFAGYSCGLEKTPNRVPNAIMAILLSMVLTLTLDLARPSHGLLTVNQQAMVDVQKTLAQSPQ